MPLAVPALVMLLVVGALGFRLIGIDFGRPYVYHPDEYAIAKPGILMAHFNGWNPHAYYYPSALMYAEKAIAIAVHHFAHAPYESTIAYGFDTAAYRAYYEAIPEQFDFYLAGRILVAILGSLTVAITFAAGRAAAGLTGGFAAAIFVALAPLAVIHAHYLTTDVPATMFVALALYLTIRGRDGGRTLIASGLVAGLAASTKYNAGAVVIAPLVIALALPSPPMARVRLAAAVTLASVVGFAVLTPVVLIDPGVILNALHGQVLTYSSRAGQTGGNSFGYWLDYLWSPALGPAFAIASVAGIVAAAVRRERTMVAILAFTVVYFVIVSFPSVRFERNLIPLFPALAILTGVALADLVKRRRLAITAVAVAVFAIGAATALAADVDNDLALMRPDPRTIALDWINANLPAGSRIAREDYSPQPSPDRYEVGVIPFLSDHPLQWYRDQKVDFLVASSYAYGWVIGPGEQFYRDLSALPLLFDIPPGPGTAVGPEIKVYDLRGSH